MHGTDVHSLLGRLTLEELHDRLTLTAVQFLRDKLAGRYEASRDRGDELRIAVKELELRGLTCRLWVDRDTEPGDLIRVVLEAPLAAPADVEGQVGDQEQEPLA